MNPELLKLILALIIIDYLRINYNSGSSNRDQGNNIEDFKSISEKKKQIQHPSQENFDNIDLSLNESNSDGNNDSNIEFNNKNNNIKINNDKKFENHSAKIRNNNINESEDKIYNLKILYCSSWGYKNYFEEIRKNLLSTYTNVKITGEIYPVSSEKQMIIYLIYSIQAILFYIIFLNSHAKGLLGSFIPLKVFEYFEAKKWGSAMITFFLGNMITGWISSTGAFEIFYDSRLLYSKIAAGGNGVPKYEDIITILRYAGVKLISG